MIHHLRKVRSSTWIKLGGGLFLLTVLLLVIPYGPILQWFTFDRIVNWVQKAHSNGWTLFVFFTAFTLGVLGLPITIFPIVGGVLFNFWIAFPVNVCAACLGAWMAYAIARFFGREAVETFLRGKFKSFDKFAAHQGIKTVLFIRLIGVPPFIVANYAFGLSGIRPRDYIVGTILGVTPWIALMTYLSNSLWQAALVGGEKGLMAAVASKLGPLIILSLLIGIGVLVNYFIRKRKKSAHHPAV